MERAILRVTPENLITVGLLTAAGYLGILGVQIAIKRMSGKGVNNAAS